MQNVIATFFLVVLCFPQDTLAKAPTVKITVSGGTLATTIDVTDARILDLSHAWGDSFLDTSRPPLEQTPQGRPPYEVSLYSQFDGNDVRKTCVLYYYPSTSREPGLVYLPGSGSAVWALNVGTVLRQGRDGKWNYSSPAWDALMKPTIATAEAAEVKPRIGWGTARTEVDNWTKPRTGWLYVLDPRPEFEGSRIWLFDPEAASVMGSIRTGYQPDMALSPDGRRLYIVSGERESGEVAVIDTAAGSVREIPFPERVLYTPWYRTLPPFTSVALSSDGGAMRILQQPAFPPEEVEAQIWTFDTASSRFSRTRAEIGNCAAGYLMPSTSANKIAVVCGRSNTLHSIRSDADRRVLSHTVVKLPGSTECRVSAGFMLRADNRLALIRSDAAIDELDLATKHLKHTGITGDCGPPWLDTSTVFALDWRSHDGGKVYVAYGPGTPDNMAASSRFRVFDARTWKQLGSTETSVPFSSAVTSANDGFIYALAPKQHAILEIDAATLQEKRVLSVGKTPAFAVVAP